MISRAFCLLSELVPTKYQTTPPLQHKVGQERVSSDQMMTTSCKERKQQVVLGKDRFIQAGFGTKTQTIQADVGRGE